MKFLKTSINEALLIDDSFFIDEKSFFENIDYLNNIALYENEDSYSSQASNSLQRQLMAISKAASLCEKFHSYFHFEQSFFYFKYAKSLSEFKNKIQMNRSDLLKKILENFELSIKQYRFNESAHIALIDFCEDEILYFGSEKYLFCIRRFESLFGKKYSKEIRVDFFKYERQFDHFELYIQFALGCSNDFLDKIETSILDKAKSDHFWHSFEIFLKSCNCHKNSCNENELPNFEMAEKAIEQICKAHTFYHQNAAKIYYNYSLIYKALNNEILSKNMLMKVKNLDISLYDSIF